MNIINALSIDVEEYFHAGRVARYYDADTLKNAHSCLPQSMAIVCDILATHQINATFFCLGELAQKYPTLIRKLGDLGHEIACHSLDHTPIYRHDAQSFFEDCLANKNILEDITGQAVKGYRAPSFSLTPQTDFFYDALITAGYGYSSSVHPIRHDHYGDPHAPRFMFSPLNQNRFLEIPVSTYDFYGKRFSLGGGGWFRLMPYGVYRYFAKKLNQQGQPVVFYTHPWEFITTHPLRPKGVKDDFLHHVNLKKMPSKFNRLCHDFAWDRMDKVFNIKRL